MATKAAETGKAFLDNTVKFFMELPGKIWDSLAAAINKVAEWAGRLQEKGSAAAGSLVKSIVDGVKALPGMMADIGRNIIDGVWKGMCNAKDAFVRNVKGFFSGIVDGVKDSLKIHSPSQVMADEVGQWLPPGIGEGFEDAMPALEKQVDTGKTSTWGTYARMWIPRSASWPRNASRK